MSERLKQLFGKDIPAISARGRLPEDRIQKVRELKAQNMTVREIAAELGVPYSVAYRALNPEKMRETSRRGYRKHAEQERARAQRRRERNPERTRQAALDYRARHREALILAKKIGVSVAEARGLLAFESKYSETEN